MAKLHIKTNDEVVVLSGAERGKRGKVLKIIPDKQRAIVEGLAMVKKHMRKTQQNPQGKIIDREGSIHISNLMRADRFEARRARQQPKTETPES